MVHIVHSSDGLYTSLASLVDGLVDFVDLFEPLPFGVFCIEFFAVVAQEEQGEEGKQDTPEGSPHADMVQEGLEANSIIQYQRRKLEVEGYGVWIIG